MSAKKTAEEFGWEYHEPTSETGDVEVWCKGNECLTTEQLLAKLGIHYTHKDTDGVRWRFAGGRPVSELADFVMLQTGFKLHR